MRDGRVLCQASRTKLQRSRMDCAGQTNWRESQGVAGGVVRIRWELGGRCWECWRSGCFLPRKSTSKSCGGVAENTSSLKIPAFCCALFSSFATNLHHISGRASSPLLTSTHLTGMGFALASSQQRDSGTSWVTFGYLECFESEKYVG